MILMASDPNNRPGNTARQSFSPHGKIMGDTRLFTGTVPFIWSIEGYLQEILDSEPKWFITLHITAQGAVTRVFKSETVEIALDQLCAVPFQLNKISESGGDPIPTSGYVLDEFQVTGTESSEQSNCIYVRITMPRAGVVPNLEIVDTKIQADWIIGAREIVLTDPPLMASTASTMVAEILID